MTLDPWTLGFQTVNVVILVWLLQHFFWRPVSAMIAERRTTAETALAEAKTAQEKAAAALADVARTRAGFGTERDAILATAYAAADKARTATLHEATEAAATLTALAKTSIETDRRNAAADWADGASGLAIDIAGRLADRLTGVAVVAAFLDGLLASIRALPEAVRQSGAAEGTVLEAVTATPLDAAGRDRCSNLIGEAFLGRPSVAFRVDPALIAGFELHGPHFIVENSWRADLVRIREDLGHAAHA